LGLGFWAEMLVHNSTFSIADLEKISIFCCELKTIFVLYILGLNFFLDLVLYIYCEPYLDAIIIFGCQIYLFQLEILFMG
jgi:hypothetical protein